MPISETQSLILSQAAQHEAGLAAAPKGLPAGARNAVFRSMLKNKLVTEINAPRAYVGLGWRQDEAGPGSPSASPTTGCAPSASTRTRATRRRRWRRKPRLPRWTPLVPRPPRARPTR